MAFTCGHTLCKIEQACRGHSQVRDIFDFNSELRFPWTGRLVQIFTRSLRRHNDKSLYMKEACGGSGTDASDLHLEIASYPPFRKVRHTNIFHNHQVKLAGRLLYTMRQAMFNKTYRHDLSIHMTNYSVSTSAWVRALSGLSLVLNLPARVVHRPSAPRK